MTFKFKDMGTAMEFIRILVANNYTVTNVYKFGELDYRVQVKYEE